MMKTNVANPAKINPRPFEMMGFNVGDYVKWCYKHDYPAHSQKTKELFFSKVRDYSIVKRNGILIENNQEV